MQQRTQTRDRMEHAGTSSSRAAARLILFFRADVPTGEVLEFPLTEHPLWCIGRVNSNHLATPGAEMARIFSRDDALMSARHAFIRRSGESWEVEDAGSKNGTCVNFERVRVPHALADGDILECGSSFFVYRDSEASGLFWPAPGSQMSSSVALSMPPLHYQMESVLPFVRSDLGIHLYGETGTGKEVVARAVHDLSGRRGKFVARNCAAIPENLFESELFGFMKGAFSGATSNKRGQVVEADNGTLFLDEIGELSLQMQAKLLRVLELKQVLPIGATEPIPVNFRLISATVCDLRAMVSEGKFRKDLYGRLGQTFAIPPLRDHKEYIGVLIPTLLAGTSLPHRPALTHLRFTVAAARVIIRYSWPFNIRELKQCIQSTLTAAWPWHEAGGPVVLDVKHLPPSLVTDEELAAPEARRARRFTPTRAPARPLSDDELVGALRAVGGNRAEAARVLGVSERTVFRRLRKLRPIDSPQ